MHQTPNPHTPQQGLWKKLQQWKNNSMLALGKDTNSV
jgi:hypothetical protein